jgi:hypothetical protein
MERLTVLGNRDSFGKPGSKNRNFLGIKKGSASRHQRINKYKKSEKDEWAYTN